MQSVAPTSSSDRQCINIDACIDFPCSVFASSCTDLPPPALNAASGRTCGACITGYSYVEDRCVNDLTILKSCHCPFDDGWYATDCDTTDSRACKNGTGTETRKCIGADSWGPVDLSQCMPGLIEPQLLSYMNDDYLMQLTQAMFVYDIHAMPMLKVVWPLEQASAT